MATVKAAPKAPKTVEQAQAAFENVTAASTEAMRDNLDRSIAAMSEVSAFGKENMEAFVASATAAQKGFEALSAAAFNFSRATMENNMTAAKALMSSKSVQELIEKQATYARTSFDSYLAEVNKMSDLVAGVTKDAMKPLNERMSAMSHLIQAGAVR